MIEPPQKILLSMSWPKWFVPKGNCSLGGAGLGLGGGFTFIAVGSYGEIQGASNVIKTIETTKAAPTRVIQPAAPLLVSEDKPGINWPRTLRFILCVLTTYNRILGSRKAYRMSTAKLTKATRSPKKTTAP